MKLLEDIVRGEQKIYHWLAVLKELHELEIKEENRLLIEQLCNYSGQMDFPENELYTHPHSKSPENMIKFIAQQKRAKLNKVPFEREEENI